MGEHGRIKWSDLILPVLVITAALAYGFYVLNYPTDKMVANYVTERLILSSLQAHLYLIVVSSSMAIATALPLGVLLTRNSFKWLCPFVVSIVNICQTIPSLAVVALFVSVLGIGTWTAIAALWIYSLLPILSNTIAGLNNNNPAVADAAYGMGMKKFRILMKIEIPLAMPVIIAGIRTAVVINVATAVIAAYVGGGGLGDLIITGKHINRWQVLLLGGGYATLIAVLFDHILGVCERILGYSR